MYDIKLISSKREGSKTLINITIHNDSDFIWNSSESKDGINLVAWWSNQNKNKMKRHFIFNQFKPGDKMEYTFYLNDPFRKSINSFISIDIVKENNGLNNNWFRDIQNEIEFIKKCSYLTNILPKDFPIIDKDSSKKSLLIETRNLDHNEFVIKNTIQKLGDGWGHIIYCHEKNHNQIKSICDNISTDIEIRLLDFELTRNSYNNLLLDINFWNEINCEKVLIYQTDTFICKDFDDKFLEYDYLGANWGPSPHTKMIKSKLKINFDLNFGNGGLSLRSKSIIERALNSENFKSRFLVNGKDKFDLDTIPEDLFFSLYTYINGKYLENNIEFSIEMMDNFIEELDMNKIPFGFHKLDRFNNWEKLIDNIFYDKDDTKS
jgi:hypothetical protein